MSKTKTTIVNADLLNSKINTENLNNVYPIDTPIFNKLGSIPNSLGKLTSYDMSWMNGSFRKLNDTGYIDYINGTLEDEKGNKVPVVNPVQTEDMVLPSKFLDITEHYYLASNGLYNNRGTKLTSGSFNNEWSIYELTPERVLIIKIKSDTTQIRLYIENNGITSKSINDKFLEEWAYDIENNFVYNISENQILYWIDQFGNINSQDLKTAASFYSLQYFSSGIVTVKALPKFYFTTKAKQMQLYALPEYSSEVAGVSGNTNTQIVLQHIELKYDAGHYILKTDYKTTYYQSFVVPTDKPNYALTNQSADPKCFKVSFNTSSGRYHYLQAAATNRHYRRSFGSESGHIWYSGIQSEEDSNEDMFYYYEYGPWKLLTFDKKNAVTYNDNLIAPFGFVDKIFEISKTRLIYINSVDQKVHCIKVSPAETKYIFDNLVDLNIRNFDSKLKPDLFEGNDGDWLTQYMFTSSDATVEPLPNSKIITPFVFGNNINYLRINNNLTLVTEGKYTIEKDWKDKGNLKMTGIGEVYFFDEGEPSEEYVTIPLAYQNETSSDLSEMEVERNIPIRQPIVNGGKVTKLTPSRYVFKYGDVTITSATLGGTVLPAFDLTAESIVTSDDTVDNIISLRGNLYTIKNNSIYGVSSDFKEVSYISSLGRMKFICNNDNLMLFYDAVLKCLVSFDASNSWSIFLNIPLLNVYQGTISNQNEIVLFTDKGVLFSRNNTMSLLQAETFNSDSLLSSNGIEFAIATHIYSPGNSHSLELETSWLGMVDCRRLFQLDAIYFEFDTTDTDKLDFDLNIDMLVDDEVQAGEFSYNVEQVGNLKYIRVQPSVQRCNAFKYSLQTNAAIKRISYSITTDEELQTVTAPVIQEFKL